MEYIK